MTVVGKHTIDRARPSPALAVPPYETSPSFPSGHTLNTWVILSMIAYLIVCRVASRTVRIAAVVLAVVLSVLMGLSRIYLGHHLGDRRSRRVHARLNLAARRHHRASTGPDRASPPLRGMRPASPRVSPRRVSVTRAQQWLSAAPAPRVMRREPEHVRPRLRTRPTHQPPSMRAVPVDAAARLALDEQSVGPGGARLEECHHIGLRDREQPSVAGQTPCEWRKLRTVAVEYVAQLLVSSAAMHIRGPVQHRSAKEQTTVLGQQDSVVV